MRIVTRLSNRFEDALVYATRLHATQTRKGTDIPYVSHLLAVASLVIEAGGTEDEAIAALLHDGPEDQGGEKTLDTIRERFGSRVVDIVSDCSDRYCQVPPKSVRLWTWKMPSSYTMDTDYRRPSSVMQFGCTIAFA